MKKALRVALAAFAAISLIAISPIPTDTTSQVERHITDIDAPGGG